ncbi:DUF429 domain-containing protein [Nocardiopsis suaedae]|uniref:DUF429 domain-containing protein n=1 Tax=Nocardiopsis suaedae TaxID=3018444 RepID=A0ABT4TDX0_9ACTN|nr:DUF429 domain-containing protein [Nocardiopsis suaedae]MDA2802912.1 DUF429 domain-containing protein [Nocardiopsis suaedae]
MADSRGARPERVPDVHVVGVDGCAGGWVAVHLREGVFSGARFHARLCALVDGAEGGVIAIDVPLGLPPDGRLWRECDLRARSALGPRRGSVFPVPSRRVLECTSREQADRVQRELAGKGVAAQAFALFPKIREAEEQRRRGVRLHGVHPEVSFAAMAGGPLAWSKRTWNGQAQRLRLLGAQGISLPDDLGQAGPVPVDDVLDAAAAAWSAKRIADGVAGSLPDPADRDEGGGPVAIRF